MYVLATDLDEYHACFGEKIARNGQAIPEISHIRVDSGAPRVTEGFDLLWLSTDFVRSVGFVDSRRGGGPLKVRAKSYPVRGVQIDALNLGAQPFALGEGRHRLETVTENHP